jgi:hypothetical protein
MKFFYSILFISLVSCVTETRPSSIIEKNKMIDIMAEVLVLETYYHSLPGNPASNKHALDSTADLVFKKSGITKKEFEESYRFYSSDLAEFKKMQAEIMEKLEKKAL